MFVKFFSSPKTQSMSDLMGKAKGSNATTSGGGKGGSARASVDYLMDKKEGEVQVLAGDPELSAQLAESLDFQNKYTVGCLTFEEPNIPETQKYEIMQKFEDTFFAGLNADQYNISWIEHTDKGRLELNFFIPNVELESGRRLQPYYDRADRHLAENFKQSINLEYGLSSPDDPQKRQTLTMNRNLPKNTKDAVRALNGLVEGAYLDGKVKNREDVVQFLETHGFEIGRQTEKYISIKNENGRNIRLKGAFYEQDFGVGGESQAKGSSRGVGNAGSHRERLEAARASLSRSTEKRLSDNQRYSRPRKTESHQQAMENIHYPNLLPLGNIGHSHGSVNLLRQSGEQRQVGSSGVEEVGRTLQSSEQQYQIKHLPNGGQNEQDLRASRSSIQGSDMGRQYETYNGKGKVDEPNYTAIAESLDRVKRAAQAELERRREEAQRAIQATQRAVEQARAGESTVEELARKVFRRIEIKLQKEAEEKQQRKLSRGRGIKL